MPSILHYVLSAVLIASPLACSKSTPGDDDGGAGGGESGGNGGDSASSGAAGASSQAGSGGVGPIAGSAGNAGLSGSGGVAASAGGANDGGSGEGGTLSGGAGGGSGGSSGAAGKGGGAGTGTGDDTLLFAPEGVESVPFEESTLTLVASTLLEGANGGELYIAVRNDGDEPACDPGAMTTFFDKAANPVDSVAVRLNTGSLYKLDNGSNTVIRCLDPGAVAMTGYELPATITVERISRLEHRFPAFEIPVVPLDAFDVSEVETSVADDGHVFTGTITNQLEFELGEPSVLIFPVNSVGRPLGMANAIGTEPIGPSGSWEFETSAASSAGAAQAVFPDASLSLMP